MKKITVALTSASGKTRFENVTSINQAKSLTYKLDNVQIVEIYVVDGNSIAKISRCPRMKNFSKWDLGLFRCDEEKSRALLKQFKKASYAK